MKMGLENAWKLADTAGHPELQFPSIHIAGTNGKGSTSSIIASILTASGYRTGLYTSPHLVNFSERIRVNGKPIPERTIIRETQQLRSMVDRLEATFFEATTTMAFRYFADERVDIAVVETGLGGRLDATNIISPLLSVITTIGFDHTEHLGHTLQAIAGEKGGIIKPFTFCISGVKQPDAVRHLRQIAKNNHAPFIQSAAARTTVREYSSAGTIFDYESAKSRLGKLQLSLPGLHQVENAKTALLAVDQLRTRFGFHKISASAIRDGLLNVRNYSGIRGRIDFPGGNRHHIVADVAHNPDGIGALVDSLRSLVAGKFLVVFGVMADKDYPEMLRKLNPVTRKLVAVSPSMSRALTNRILVDEARRVGMKAMIGGSVAQGVRVARKDLRKEETLLITGSHYVVGEALPSLGVNIT